jgi:ADP-heptose:LPS heptosyltransferase
MDLKSQLYDLQFRTRQRLLGLYYGAPKGAAFGAGSFAPNRVVFILSGLIGDSVMSYPAVAAARFRWPDAHIAVVGKTHNREIFAACTEFDEFYVCDADPLSLRRSAEVSKLQRWLVDEKFDAAIILLGDQYAHLLARARIPVRVGVAGTLMQGCLTHTYDIGSPRTWGTNERLNAVRCLGVAVEASVPSIDIDPQAKESVAQKLAEFGIAAGERYAVLHPFGSSRRQWWNTENAAPLAKALAESHGLKTLLVGGSETAGVELPAAHIADARGKISLRELLAAIDASEVVITTDSGPFHIAGALGKKTVGLFRARRPEHERAYPTAEIILGRNAECMKSCEWDNCRADPCRQMADVTILDVIAVAAPSRANSI